MKSSVGRIALCACLSMLSMAAVAQQQAPTVIYSEDFQNNQATDIATISKVGNNTYTGATGATYTASPSWLTNCNGWLSAWNQDSNPAAPTANGECNNQAAWNNVQELAEAIGLLNGEAAGTTGEARNNIAVSAYTQANPAGAPANIEIQSSQITLSGSGRFLIFGVDVAAVNCAVAGAAAPVLQFYAVDSGGNATAAGGSINACTGASTTVTAEAIGASAAQTVNVGHYTSGAVLVSTASTSIRINNLTFTGSGNDHAFDNLFIEDATPTLSKAFSTAQTTANTTVQLTFTVTNTTDNLQKQGWAFTDTFPAGLTIADTTVSSTCTGTTVTVTTGGNTVVMSNGNLPAGVSCTVTVDVKASAPGTYVNGPSNISGATGINPPTAPTTLTIPSPLPPPSAAPINSLWMLALIGLCLLAIGYSVTYKQSR